MVTDEVELFDEVRARFGGGSTAKSGTGNDADGAGGDGTQLARREGQPGKTPWPHKVRLYGKAAFLQAGAMLLSLLLWHRLNTTGGGRKKPNGTAVPSKT